VELPLKLSGCEHMGLLNSNAALISSHSLRYWTLEPRSLYSVSDVISVDGSLTRCKELTAVRTEKLKCTVLDLQTKVAVMNNIQTERSSLKSVLC